VLLLLAPPGAKAAAPGSEEITAAPPDVTLLRARQFLRAGRTAEAERLVSSAVAVAPADALLCLSGEIEFRRARFAEASKDFSAALALNPENARAHWGLGRIDQIHFRSDAAREHFSRAYALNHRDTDIILSFAEFVDDASARATLLRNVAFLARQEQPERAERAIADLRVLERLQGRAPARLAGAYKPYRVPLSGFRPAGVAQDGVLIPVRINGGKPLRLLLDTGARGIVVDSRAARNLDLETLTPAGLHGFGEDGVGASYLALAGRVSFGDLAFDECLVQVSAHSLTTGADGVAGIDLFERFQILIDPAAPALQLTPFEDTAVRSAGAIPAVGLRGLLLLNTRVEGREGLFLVDTGAAYTSVDRRLAPAAYLQGDSVTLSGAQGSLATAARVGTLRFQIDDRSLLDNQPVTLDLAPFSQIEGVEISGILGYSALRYSPLRIDLRHGTVEFVRAR
jgi:tetratricopeptide (TPR) repeat protein